MKLSREAILHRIEVIEESIRKAKEYLESGKHANWNKFRPWFGRKAELPPHKDWVKNVFLRRREKALARAEKLLDRVSLDKQKARSIARRQGRRRAAG